MGQGAKMAMPVLLGMVILLASNMMPSSVSRWSYWRRLPKLVLFRVISVDQAYRSIRWTTVILVGAMIPLSTAMTKTAPRSCWPRGW